MIQEKERFSYLLISSSCSAWKTQKTHDDSKDARANSEKDHLFSLDRGDYTGHSGSGRFLQ